MDRLSSIMVRISLLWLLAGFVIGGLMLTDRKMPGDWRLWFTPGHGHMLFVGWFMQFALGIAYWLLPRKRSDTLPLGYREELALGAVLALNIGLALRVTAEAWERAGHASDLTFLLLAAASILQIAAATVFVGQLWRRTGVRAKRIPAQA
jgi:hypothetical protein